MDSSSAHLTSNNASPRCSRRCAARSGVGVAADREERGRGEAAGARLCRPRLRPGPRAAAQRLEGAEVVAQGRARTAAGRPYPESAAQEAAHLPGRARFPSGSRGSNRIVAMLSKDSPLGRRRRGDREGCFQGALGGQAPTGPPGGGGGGPGGPTKSLWPSGCEIVWA
jgi:hypothetical protein